MTVIKDLTSSFLVVKRPSMYLQLFHIKIPPPRAFLELLWHHHTPNDKPLNVQTQQVTTQRSIHASLLQGFRLWRTAGLMDHGLKERPEATRVIIVTC